MPVSTECVAALLSFRYPSLSIISIRKGRRFVSKQGQPKPHIHSKARITVKWSIARRKYDFWKIALCRTDN